MRDFGEIGITEAQIDLLEVAQKFCHANSPMESVRALIEDEITGYDVDVWKDIAALGWLGIAVPEKLGGSGLSLAEIVPVVEQMGRYMLHSPFISTSLAIQAILAGATQAQIDQILLDILGGAPATLALSEANSDWDLNSISATAMLQNNRYILSGTKTFVADLLSAKWIVMSVKIDAETRLVILPRADIPDTAFRRETLIDETKRSYSLTLDGLTIDADMVMDRSKTSMALKHIHLVANLLFAAEMTGACQACIDYTVEYLGTRKQFGRLIGSFQALKHPTVDAFVDYQKARSLLYSSAYSFMGNTPDLRKCEISTRMVAVQAKTALSFAADRAIQFHGGFGFSYDCDAQLYRRRAIFLSSQYGDGRYHKEKLAQMIFS